MALDGFLSAGEGSDEGGGPGETGEDGEGGGGDGEEGVEEGGVGVGGGGLQRLGVAGEGVDVGGREEGEGGKVADGEVEGDGEIWGRALADCWVGKWIQFTNRRSYCGYCLLAVSRSLSCG